MDAVSHSGRWLWDDGGDRLTFSVLCKWLCWMLLLMHHIDNVRSMHRRRPFNRPHTHIQTRLQFIHAVYKLYINYIMHAISGVLCSSRGIESPHSNQQQLVPMNNAHRYVFCAWSSGFNGYCVYLNLRQCQLSGPVRRWPYPSAQMLRHRFQHL